jgi:co-chaperonin GroES (HSP10)
MNQEQTAPVIDNITPIGFRTLLKIYKRPDRTSNDFVLPEQENSGMPVMGEITTLGKKTPWQHVQLFFGFKPRYKVGQCVYFRKYSVDELRISNGDEELIMFVLEDAEIIGIIN